MLLTACYSLCLYLHTPYVQTLNVHFHDAKWYSVWEHAYRKGREMNEERERICEYLLFRTFTFIQFKLLDITWHYGSQSNQHHANAVQRYASLEFARAQPYTHVHLSEIFTCSMYKFCIFGAIIRFNQMNFRICERVCVWALGTQNALMYAD